MSPQTFKLLLTEHYQTTVDERRSFNADYMRMKAAP